MSKSNKNKNKNNNKSLSTGKKLLIILLLTCSWVWLGICVGFVVKDILSLVFAVPAAILAFIMLLILLKDYKTEKKEKTAKWYVDKFIAGLVPVWVIAAISIIIIGYEEDESVMYMGFLMFPVISMLISPNAALYAVRDTKGWKRIFYGKGNLERFKEDKDFYTVKAPVPFEKRLFRAVVKNELLNVFTVISALFVVSVIGVFAILTYDSHSVSPGDVIGAVFYVRVRRGTGVMAFYLLLALVFGFPAFVYYVTNAVYKLRFVSKHKYMAYHAVVYNMHDYVLNINSEGRYYKYKFATLVGMKESQINNTPAVLVFIPDDVFVFPDEVFKTESE